MTSVLVVVSWLQLGGPQMSMQSFETQARCEGAREVIAKLLLEQARTNLVGAHELVSVVEPAHGTGAVISLRTTTTGREVVRLQCV